MKDNLAQITEIELGFNPTNPKFFRSVFNQNREAKFRIFLLLSAFLADLFFVCKDQHGDRFFTKMFLDPLLILICFFGFKGQKYSINHPPKSLILTGFMVQGFLKIENNIHDI